MNNKAQKLTEREQTEETKRGKKITGISQDPHQKKVFKENRIQSKVDGKQVLDRGL